MVSLEVDELIRPSRGWWDRWPWKPVRVGVDSASRRRWNSPAAEEEAAFLRRCMRATRTPRVTCHS